MTGEEVNYSPALTQAQIEVAMGSGTDIVAATADIILVNSNPLDIAALILFGRVTYKKMVQNLKWATGYNVIAIPPGSGSAVQCRDCPLTGNRSHPNVGLNSNRGDQCPASVGEERGVGGGSIMMNGWGFGSGMG